MQLIHLGAISKSYAPGEPLSVTPYGWSVLRGEKTLELALVRESDESPVKSRFRLSDDEPKDELFETLRELRRELAQRENVPAYLIFSDKVLSEIAKEKPTSLEEFAEIPGVGNFKLKKYGELFIREICRST